MIRRFLAGLMLALGAIVALLLLGALPVLLGALPVLAASSSSGPTTSEAAGALVLIWGLVAPLTVYKWIPLDDAHMKAITLIASLVIALIALFVSNAISLSSFNGLSLVTIGGLASAVYGESQLVWTLFKDQGNPKLQGLVTEPPAPAAPK